MLSAGQTTFSSAAVLPPTLGSSDLPAGVSPVEFIDDPSTAPSDDGAAATTGRQSVDDEVILIPMGPPRLTTTWQSPRLFARPTSTSDNRNGAPAAPPANQGNRPSSPGSGGPGGESGAHATPVAKALELIDKLDSPYAKVLALLEIASVTRDERFVLRAEKVARDITNPHVGDLAQIRILRMLIAFGPDAAAFDKGEKAALIRTVEHMASEETAGLDMGIYSMRYREVAGALDELNTALISRGWVPPLELRLVLVPFEVEKMFRPMAFKYEESFEIKLRRATLYASDLTSRGEFDRAKMLFHSVVIWTEEDLPKMLRRLRMNASEIDQVQKYAFGRIAEEMASAGLFEEAVIFAKRISLGTHRNQVHRTIVRVMAKAGRVDEAMKVAGKINDKFVRILAFVDIKKGSAETAGSRR